MASISYLLDDWVVYPEKSLIEKDGEVIHLEPKVMEVLVYLLENCNRVVSREELNEKVWKSRYTSDDVITRAISVLRKKLHDQGKVHQYIKTIPKHGYLLDYTPSRNEQHLPSLDEPPADFITVKFKKLYVFIGLLALILTSLAWFIFHDQGSRTDPVKLRIDNFTASDNLDESILVAKSLTQQLITTLGNSEHVQVSLNNQFIDAEAVNFDYFVGGAVRRINQDFQVSVHFANAKEGEVIWSQTFAGNVADWHLLVNSVANTLDYFIEVVDRDGLDLDEMSIESMQTALLIHQARQLRMVSSQENYLLAIQLLENGVRTYPQSEQLPVELGIAYYRAAIFFDNPEYFVKMRSLWGNGKQDDIRLEMAFVQGLYRHANGELTLEQVIQVAEQSASSMASQPEYHSYLASFYMKNEQYRKAQRHLQQALKLAPGFSVATFYYAKLQSIMGQNQSAIDTLTTYLNFNGQDYSARYLLAWLLVETGRFSEAINFLNQSVIKDDSKELKVLLAQSYFYLDMPLVAKQHYQQLLRQSDAITSAQIECQLAIVLNQGGEAACVLANSPHTALIFGRYQMLLGNNKQALEIYQQFFSGQQPSQTTMRLMDWVDYVWLLFKTGDVDKAQGFARQLLENTSEQQIIGYDGKGVSDVVLLLVLQDVDAAIAAFDNAIAEGWLHLHKWQYGGVHPALATIKSKKRYQEGVAYIEQLLERQKQQLLTKKSNNP
ncbi:tetratricopeptide repeat protein [Thalassotalea litorea]|uniref:Tetratricopeptide repeat protein n=1 Tax=Thalassotalea litorea TaxID=2020715 RepID=A0A5R9IL43_9GAMM|nr:winged helix-turn-helix domain-containing protein [Thalassotalea litorea]TLU66240.1 tetratricopeptide repeat protein [Thalassotalea litorea]